MEALLPFLYQFIGGGIVLIAGYWGAVRSGALVPSSPEGRKWIVLVISAVLMHVMIQGSFQFLLSAK
ncbi:MAG: hypothetical protein P9L94_00015 [Candidatus Hinthialibacter antarcticus]|nr:hypothetical protein [Candidatus Hinthialibacter antarcticus]